MSVGYLTTRENEVELLCICIVTVLLPFVVNKAYHCSQQNSIICILLLNYEHSWIATQSHGAMSADDLPSLPPSQLPKQKHLRYLSCVREL